MANGTWAAIFPFAPDTLLGNRFFYDYVEQGGITPVPPVPSGIDVAVTVAEFNPQANGQADQPGPWLFNGARYMVLMNTVRLFAYKSLDGNTWTEVDGANAPLVGNNTPAPNVFLFYGCVRNGSKVYVVFWHTDHTVRLIPFNMATDTWGTPVGSTLAYINTTLGQSPDASTGFAVAFQNGKIIAAMVPKSVLVATSWNRSYYAKCDPLGAWDANWTACGETNAGLAEHWTMQGAVTDDQNRVHLFFFVENHLVDHDQIWHQVLHTDNSLSAPDLAFSHTPADLSEDAYSGRPIARPITGGTELLFPVLAGHEIGDTVLRWFVIRGTASDAPVWTVEQPLPDVSNTDFTYAGFALTTLGSLVAAFYILVNLTANTAQFAYVTSASPWSAPVVWGASPGDDITLGSVFPSFFSVASFTGSLSIVCNNPPVGIVRTFYVHELPATGGVPPYSFAITAGSLPTGLILNALTGEISGLPLVNGVFPFTVQVTDSALVTAQVNCSITIQKRCLLVEVR